MQEKYKYKQIRVNSKKHIACRLTEQGSYMYIVRILDDNKYEDESFELLKEFKGLFLYKKVINLSKETLSAMFGLMLSIDINKPIYGFGVMPHLHESGEE